jgi:pyrroloquinoline quinone biosynthesis protein B
MKVVVLGSGAGGGFPQWNCNCDNCRRLRAGQINARPRTQASIAVSNGVERDGVESWILFGASPDVRAQIESFPPLWPARGTRDTPIAGIVLVDAQVDHTTGLMTLRECHRPLEVYCTRLVHQDLTSGYPLLSVLQHYCGVHWHEVPVSGDAFAVAGADGLRLSALPIESNAPPFSPRRGAPQLGDNICVRIDDLRTGGSLLYAPGLGVWTDDLSRALEECSCILVDGTVWHDDDMARAGARNKLAREMGHLHHAGPGGLLQRLAALNGPRKILTHINNTNPVLDEDSAEHAELRRAGVELAYDGMRLEL